MSKILIAEDDRITARILEKHLSDWGYTVFLEKNGEDAWMTLDKEHIQIALLDWMMPRLDGLQLCQKVRTLKSEPYTYIILLTARTGTEDIVKGLNAGADDYITKPVEPSELRARLLTGNRIIELENKNRRLQERLEKMAREDSLTGFLNKKHIQDRLEEELSRGRRERRPIGAILMDIDRFKQINDTYGHHVGDKVIQEIAERLRRNIRRHDQLGRYGGDEVLVLLWNAGTSTLSLVADRLCRCISRDPIPTDAGPLQVTLSAGGASTEGHWDVSAPDLIKVIDQALYAAKAQGRDRSEIISIPDQ